MSEPLKLDDHAACDTCGRFGAFRFEGETICPECYATRGACCAEFGGSDLWRDRDAPPCPPPPPSPPAR